MRGIGALANSFPVVDEESAVPMQNARIHRGPDGGGKFYDSHLALATRRLSIIDINGGPQPFTNGDHSGRIGEI